MRFGVRVYRAKIVVNGKAIVDSCVPAVDWGGVADLLTDIIREAYERAKQNLEEAREKGPAVEASVELNVLVRVRYEEVGWS